MIEAKHFFLWWTGKEASREKVETLLRLRDPLYLPTRKEIRDTFTHQAIEERNRITDWDGYIYNYAPFSIYEVFTKEHIGLLSDYLAKRIAELNTDGISPVTVLDPCAGIGRLPYFLQQHLEQIVDKEKFRIVASDNKSWHVKGKPVFSVENVDYRQAVQAHQPQIIVASWIPGVEATKEGGWLSFFRNTRSVREYILIGRPYWENMDRYRETKDTTPDYVRDGFVRLDHNWGKYQVCYEDKSPIDADRSISETISYIRQSQQSRRA